MEKPYGKVEISLHKVLRKLSEAGILLLTPLYKKSFKTEDIVFYFSISQGTCLVTQRSCVLALRVDYHLEGSWAEDLIQLLSL